MWPKLDTHIDPEWSMSTSSRFVKQRITARKSGMKVGRGWGSRGGGEKKEKGEGREQGVGYRGSYSLFRVNKILNIYSCGEILNSCNLEFCAKYLVTFFQFIDAVQVMRMYVG